MLQVAYSTAISIALQSDPGTHSLENSYWNTNITFHENTKFTDMRTPIYLKKPHKCPKTANIVASTAQ